MRRPRFRLRTIMIAVALVALALGGSIQFTRLTGLSKEYRRKSAVYDELELLSLHSEKVYLASYHEAEKDALKFAGYAHRQRDRADLELADAFRECESIQRIFATRQRQSASQLRGKAADYAHMKEKYQRAADQPWLSVPPDAPQSDFGPLIKRYELP